MYTEGITRRIPGIYRSTFRIERDSTFGFRQMRFRSPDDDITQMRAPSLNLPVRSYFSDSKQFFWGTNDRYSFEHILSQEHTLNEGITLDRVVLDLRQFLLEELYPDRDYKEDIVSESVVRQHSVNLTNLLIVRDRSEGTILGFGGGELRSLGDSQESFIYLAGTMIKPRHPFGSPLMTIINYRIIENAMTHYWKPIDDPPFPLPYVVAKTQNPIVLKSCLAAFYPNNLQSPDIANDSELRSKLSQSFGRTINNDWIVQDDYPQRMWTAEIEQFMRDNNGREIKPEGLKTAVETCDRFRAEPTNSVLFVGKLDIFQFLEKAKMTACRSGDAREKALKMQKWMESQKQ